MSGVKRDARDIADREQPPHQRARYDRPQGFDGVPAGPRSMAQQPTNSRSGGGDRRNGNGNGSGNGKEKSIFDRVQSGGNQAFGQQGPFDAVRSLSASSRLLVFVDLNPSCRVTAPFPTVASPSLLPASTRR